MAKKDIFKEFIVQQSDIDKAINYHRSKGGDDHVALIQMLTDEAFYSYCIETMRRRIKPYDGFRKILTVVVDSLYCDKPQITIKTVNGITHSTELRIAKNYGLR